MVLVRASLAALLAAAVTVAPSAQTEAQQTIFRSTLDLVSVAVVVRDDNGRIVRNLRAEDFEIIDSGETRAIVQFHRGDDADARLALLVDSSGSMVLSGKRERSVLATHLLTAGFGGEDEATVFSFDSSVRRLTPYTRNPETLMTAVASVEPYGGTCLYDAIVGTVESIREETPRTRAIVLLTDGVDTGSSITPRDAATAAAALDVPIYVLGVGDEMREPAVAPPVTSGTATVTLSELARRTGGMAAEARSTAQLSIVTRTILSELRHQYMLAFSARSQSGWHPLSVRVRQGRVQARSRDGYLVR
jgi:Ca-activated chloride channel homolog